VGKNPTDRGKLGTKRSVLTEGGGVPVGLAVDGANRNAFKMARATIESLPMARPEPTPDKPQGMCLDKGYD
jgi:putative transposase